MLDGCEMLDAGDDWLVAGWGIEVGVGWWLGWNEGVHVRDLRGRGGVREGEGMRRCRCLQKAHAALLRVLFAIALLRLESFRVAFYCLASIGR